MELVKEYSAENEEGKSTCCNSNDLERIINEIEKIKERADYVFISIHSHQIKRDLYIELDIFLEEFFHKCIDAGTSEVISSETRQLKLIEIYKGKPIFYSLGNFVFENHLVEKLPADFWDKYCYLKSLTVEEEMNRKIKNWTIGLETDVNNYLSVILTMIYEGNKLSKLSLTPIELNFNSRKELKRLPRFANVNGIEYILEQLRKISRVYGTKFNTTGKQINIVLK